jgi:hypothetical protein
VAEENDSDKELGSYLKPLPSHIAEKRVQPRNPGNYSYPMVNIIKLGVIVVGGGREPKGARARASRWPLSGRLFDRRVAHS